MALNLFEKLKNALNSNTTTNVDTYTNDGMNLSGVNNIQNARGTAKVEMSTISTPRNDASNLAGTNNIQSARGTSTKSVQNNVQRNNDVYESTPSQGKTVSTNTVKNNIQTYQPVLSSVADESNKKVADIISKIGNNAQPYHQERLKEIQNQKAQELTQYTDQDLKNSIVYTNAMGETLSANDFDNEVEQWKNDIDLKANKLEELNNSYKNGDYGFDEVAYENYKTDYDNAYAEYQDAQVKGQDYFNSFKNTEFADFQAQLNDVNNQIKEVQNSIATADEIAVIGLSQQLTDLRAIKKDLRDKIKKQNAIKYSMALEQAENDTEATQQLNREIIALNENDAVRGIKASVTGVANDVANLLDVTSVGVDLVSDEAGKVIKGVAESLYKNGSINNAQYVDLVEASQLLINYTVKNDGLMKDVRKYLEEEQRLANLGPASTEFVAAKFITDNLVGAGGIAMLGALYPKARAVSGGVQRYIQLTEQGIDPTIALTNASIMSASKYYLDRIAFDYNSAVFGVMSQSALTQEAMQFLLSRSAQSAGITGIASFAEYGIDWINNEVTEYLTKQTTGLNYTTGDMFRNAFREMGNNFVMTFGRGAVESGINSLRGMQSDGRTYTDYVQDFDYKMTMNLRAKYLRKNYGYEMDNWDTLSDEQRRRVADELMNTTPPTYVSRDNPYYNQFRRNFEHYYSSQPTESTIPNEYVISSQKEYNQASAERDLMVEIYNNPNTPPAEKEIITMSLVAVDKGLENYENKSLLGNKVILQSDMPSVYSLQQAQEGYVNGLVPNAVEFLNKETAITEFKSTLDSQTQEKMSQLNIVGNVNDLETLDRDTLTYVLDYATATKSISNGRIDVVIDLTMPMGKPGETVRFDDGSVQVRINPLSSEGIKYLSDHEQFHAIYTTPYKDRIIEFLNRNSTQQQKLEAQRRASWYPEDEQEEEFYAYLYGDTIKDTEILERMKNYEPQIYNEVSNNALEVADNLYGVKTELDALLDDIIYAIEYVGNADNDLERTLIDLLGQEVYDEINGRTNVEGISNNTGEIQGRPGSITNDFIYNGQQSKQGVRAFFTPNNGQTESESAEVEGAFEGSLDNRVPRLSPEEQLSLAETYHKKSSKVIAFDTDRLNYYLSDKGFASSNPKYAQAYIAWMDLRDFARLNPPRYYETGELDEGDLKESLPYWTKPIHMNIENERGDFADVAGHEGRHRVNALAEAGYKKMPVLLFNNENKYEKTKHKEFYLEPDSGSIYKDKVVLTDVIPLSLENKDEIIAKFGSEAEADIHLVKNDQLSEETDNRGNRMTIGQVEHFASSIGDRVDPTDPNSPHMMWVHGTPNAVFTKVNNAEERGTTEEYQNDSKATYLTSSPDVASTYSGTDKTVDPYNLQKKPKTLKELKNVLKELDVEVAKLDGDFVLYGDGLIDLVSSDYNMDTYWDLIDESSKAYIDLETGKLISDDYAYDNDLDIDDESKYKEIKVMNTYNNNVKNLIDQIWNVNYPNRGNYEVYAKSENPLIIDVQGKRWDELPSLGTIVEQEADDPKTFMPEYEGLKTVNGINKYFDEKGYGQYTLFEVGPKLEKHLLKKYEKETVDEAMEKYKKADIKYVLRRNTLADHAHSYVPPEIAYLAFKDIEGVIREGNLPQPNEEIKRELTTTRDYEQYALDNGYDSIRYLNIVDNGPYTNSEEGRKPSDVLVVFSPEQIKSVNNPNPTNNQDIRYATDPTRKLANKLSEITDVKLDDELNEMIDLAESQIAFTGELTDQMRGALAQKLYESTYYEMEGYDEITPTDINRFLRENPIRWATLKGDNNLSLVEFQKEHPGVKFSKDGGKDWDVIAMDFNEQFPGLIDPEMINSPVDFLDELQTLKEQLSKYNGTQRIDPGNYEQFYKQYDKIIDNFIKENSPKLSQPREMSDARMKSIDRQRELFRNSVSEWVRDYDVVRDKYDAFDKKAFDDAMADVYIIGEVTPETKAELKESIIRNDFEGYYVNGKADKYIEDFVNEAVDYYVLESEYLVDQRYRDKIAKTANIINQAKSQMYEEDYDRSETAKLINDLAKLQKGRDYDAVYEDVEYIVENIDNKKNVFYNRDLKEYNDLVSGNNKVLREKLYDVIESPIRHAQAQELETLQKYKKEFTDLQKETGIKMYSDEDNAIGWIIKGKTQDGTPYDITDLKRDFPNKWQDIMKVVEYYKPLMEKWYNEEITEKERIYGDVEYQNEVKTARLENNLESAKAILEKRGQDLKKNPNPKTQAGYAKAQKAVKMAQKKLNAQLEKNLQHSDTRKQYTPHRKNYFHHTNEVKFTKNAKAFFEMLKSGIGRQNNIPTELAGRTDITKPRTTNQSYMWKQGQTNYSTSGFASLQHRLHEHANAMAFDSVVSYLRNVENAIEELDANNNANNYMTWFRKYVNTLAGKTNDLDRIIRDMTPSETTAIINALNNRARKNAVYGNISSALVQSGNFPVGMGLAVRNGGPQALQDLVKGTALYLSDMKSENPIKNGSTFLNLRYFDLDLNDARLSAKMDRFGNFMMTVLDKVSAEQMWYMFYSQGERLGVENPILYADDMVDRSIQGRRVEDMPISQQSEIIKLLAPFQVEVNNQWQVMKDLAKGAVKGDNKASSIAGLIALTLTSVIMNMGFRKILNRDPLFDPIGAIIDVAGDEDLTLQEMETKMSSRVIGEIIGAIPYGQYIPGLLGLSDEQASEIFGESDPSRYGIGNIGLSTVVKLLTAQTDEERMKALEDVIFTYGPSGYGKQLQRFYREGQDFGYAPKYVNGEWRMDPIHYTKSGGVAFVNDPKDVFDYMRGAIGGQYSTKAGREYIESGFKKLGIESLKDPEGNTIKSSQALQVRKMMQDVGVYDQIVEEILSGKMTPAKAGLSKTVIEMSDEEFEAKYNAMQQIAEGIGQQIKNQYNWTDEQSSAFEKALEIEPDYQDGKKVTDSEALKTRKALEDAGIYDSVIDYIEANGIAYSDVGLGKRVVGYDDDKFLEIYAQKIGGK